jgi:putative SOS response-associated peptidase YedK
VVADAYYEWSSKGTPFLVYLRKKNRPIGFAGIYDIWTDPVTKEEIKSFALISTTANEMLQGIGVKRMPVILPTHYETNWLKPTLHLSEILRYFVPFPSEKMNAYPVSALVNSDEINDASLLNPIGEKLQLENSPPPVIRSRYYHKSKPVSDKPWFKSTSQEP